MAAMARGSTRGAVSRETWPGRRDLRRPCGGAATVVLSLVCVRPVLPSRSRPARCLRHSSTLPRDASGLPGELDASGSLRDGAGDVLARACTARRSARRRIERGWPCLLPSQEFWTWQQDHVCRPRGAHDRWPPDPADERATDPRGHATRSDSEPLSRPCLNAARGSAWSRSLRSATGEAAARHRRIPDLATRLAGGSGCVPEAGGILAAGDRRVI
jgi:hypothetical protein